MKQSSVRSIGKQLSFEGTIPDDHEDEETQQDFETFKTWLASVNAAEEKNKETTLKEQQPDTNVRPTQCGGSGIPVPCTKCKSPKGKCTFYST